jgi:crotonobetainyl-CoA:carnitine CoA-transferase CaiB-like acyl-CoA transferase
MASDNIFSGLKVLDFASFIAGPSAAMILSDFGADVIKVEPPSSDLWRHGHKMPPQPQDPYQWHLTNRNKRGMTLDLKSPSAQILEELKFNAREIEKLGTSGAVPQLAARVGQFA